MHFTKPVHTFALAAAVLLAATLAHADIIPIGSSLTFGGTNSPDTYSDTTTFGTTSLLDGGAVSLTTFEVATPGGGDWAVFEMSPTSGGPLANDTSSLWNIVIDYTLSEAVDFDQVVDQFTVNGTPVSPLSDFAGICCATATNPSPISGEAYYNSFLPSPLSAGVQSNWQQIFVSPYSFVAAGGVDPSTANGFNFALHFSPQVVPEPAEVLPLFLFLTGGIAGLALQRRRRRRQTQLS